MSFSTYHIELRNDIIIMNKSNELFRVLFSLCVDLSYTCKYMHIFFNKVYYFNVSRVVIAIEYPPKKQKMNFCGENMRNSPPSVKQVGIGIAVQLHDLNFPIMPGDEES